MGTQSKAFARLRENFTKTTEKIQTAQRELNGLRQAQQAGNAMTDKQREHMAMLTAKLNRLNEVRTREKEKAARGDGCDGQAWRHAFRQ